MFKAYVNDIHQMNAIRVCIQICKRVYMIQTETLYHRDLGLTGTPPSSRDKLFPDSALHV